MKSVNVIYIDRLSFYSLIAVILSGKKYSHIIYFNISLTVKKLLKGLLLFKVVKVMPELLEFHLADVCDEKGKLQFFKITEDILNICKKIEKRRLRNENFLKMMGKYFNFEKLLLYYKKVISNEIYEVICFINVAVWYTRERFSEYGGKMNIYFFLEKNLWSKDIIDFANKFNIELVEYKVPIKQVYLKTYFPLIKKQVCLIIKLKVRAISKIIAMKKKIEIRKQRNFFPCIAVSYNGRNIREDLNKTTDIFWAITAKVPYDRVIMYFSESAYPATQDMIDFMAEKGIKFVALSKQATKVDTVPVWRGTKTLKKMKKKFVKLIIWNYFKNIIKLNFVSFFYFFNIYYFVLKYSYWYDFFEFNNVRININPDTISKSSIPMNLALQESGGVSIAYQWSNWVGPSIGLSNATDVFFSFGPYYRQIWEKSDSLVNNLIFCGYITDHSFKEVKSDSLKLRKQLFDKGVKFIICYFDENSSDHRMSLITNKRTEHIYRYFLEELLKDETLGIIFKPKYAWSIYQRIAPIKELLEKAKATGRCMFVDGGGFKTDKYPAEFAQVSDLCVGLLLAGTVVLESYLSGSNSVFIDLERLDDDVIYSRGKGKIVFDNLDDLFISIQKYRQNPNSIKGFGDLSEWIEGKDSFMDGNASLRMGMYVNYLIEMFNERKTREESLINANKKYAKIWGEKNVIQF